METHLSIREARRMFSGILNLAAFGNHRVLIVRHKEEVGAFVNMDDVDFLRRYRPGTGEGLSVKALAEDAAEMKSRAELLDRREELFGRMGAGEHEWAELAAERQQLAADFARLEAMMKVRKPLAAAARASGGGVVP